jgi:hypothetical protein
MTEFNPKLIESRINQLADLIYEGWQGDGHQIATDYAYLLSEGGNIKLLNKHIAEYKKMAKEMF